MSRKNKIIIFFSFIINTTAICLPAQTNAVLPVNPTVEMLNQPVGVDVSNPVFGWNLATTNAQRRGVKQTAYHILVSSSAEMIKKNEGNCWNSGKVVSDKMGQIIYAGKPLLSGKKYWWKVKVWDEQNKVSAWSKPSTWIMGLLSSKDWKAKWITANGADKYALQYDWSKKDFRKKNVYAEQQPNAPTTADANYSSMLLQREFSVRSGMVRAVIHISGLGQYELSINDNKIGDYLLTPGWTNYNKTVLYDSYDVTAEIKNGKNAVGIILGNSMYNIQPDSVRYVKFINSYGPLKAIAQLEMEYTDGTVQVINSDHSWSVSPGPITYSNVFGGEDYDANLEPKGWNKTDFNADASWSNAIETTGPGGELKGLSCASPPIKAIENLQPVSIKQLKPTVWVYDLGQNASVMPRILVRGAKGSYVRIIPSELLHADGTVDRTSATQDGVRPAWWQFTISSNETELFFPKFFYQGGRYLQVELFPAPGDNRLPLIKKLEGVVVHTSSTPVGNFSCSNELFNKIYHLIRWAQRSNLMSVITDCPHREKLSWLEQYHLNGPSLRYNYNLNAVFKKGMQDMFDSQLENGFIPNIAPEYFIAGPADLSNGFRNSPEWGSSFIIVPWQQYLFSGDVSLLRRYYEPMKKYVAFLNGYAKNNILPTGLGDWYDMGPKEPWGSQLTPVALTATAIYYYDNWILAQTARLLDNSDEANIFEKKADEIRTAFNKEFYNPETGQYATGSQTANAMPLVLNITEPQNRKKVIEAIVADIKSRGNALTSGDVGYRYLLYALAMEGYSNVIYDMNNQSDRPGYGYQLKMGATSLTEKWNAGVGNFGSQNHFMLGQINEWFFHDLVGIAVEPDGAGFAQIMIKPIVVGDISWAKGSYQSVSGLITVNWKLERDIFSLDVTIPANTTALIYLPNVEGNAVKESGKIITRAIGIKFVKTENDKVVYEVGSGSYHFSSKIK